jgi:hypothetical protein
MGKPIKIEISDTMPCNEDDEYLLPRCDDIQELWPALLTKALLKLNSYKINYKEYHEEEIGDLAIFYQLTGYIGLYMNTQEISFESLSNYLSDDSYAEKKCFVFCLNKNNRNERKLKTIKEVAETTLTQVFKRGIKKSSKTIIAKDFHAMKTMSTKVVTQLRDLNRRGSVNVLNLEDPQILQKEKTERRARKVGTTNHLPNISEFIMEAEKNFDKIANTSESTGKFRISPPNSQKRLGGVGFLGAITNYINENKIIPNIAYSIPDFFDSLFFNMKRLKPLDFSDLKNILKAAQDRYKSIFKTLTKEQRKNELNEFNELRKKQKLEKANRIEELKEKGKKFALLKIKNDIIGSTHLNFLVPYTDEEIYMAKKCILNKWEFPPPSFFDNQEKEKLFNFKPNQEGTPKSPTKDRFATLGPLTPMTSADKHFILEKDNDDISGDGENKDKDKGKTTWNKETYLQQLINNNIDQYFLQRDPIAREEDGTWVDIGEIKGMFNLFAVLSSPKAFKNVLYCDNNWQYYSNDILELKEEYEVFGINSLNEINTSDETAKSTLLINFQPNTEINPHNIFNYNLNFYLTFDLINAAGDVIKQDITLNKFFQSYIMIDLDKNESYYLIMKGHFAPFGFFLQFFANNHQIENMTFNNYLKKAQNYQVLNYKLDHINLEKNKFYLLSRYSISLNELTKVRFTLRYPDKFAKQCVELFLNTNNYGKKRITFDELITLHPLDMFDNYYVRFLFKDLAYFKHQAAIYIDRKFIRI